MIFEEDRTVLAPAADAGVRVTTGPGENKIYQIESGFMLYQPDYHGCIISSLDCSVVELRDHNRESLGLNPGHKYPPVVGVSSFQSIPAQNKNMSHYEIEH